jgi:hypothetical protein
MVARPFRDTAGDLANAGRGTLRRLVERKCAVCEWHDEVSETAADTIGCPWCHAPTELVRVIGSVEPPLDAAHDKNPHAAALGRLGGLKGGRARAEALSATRRRELARKAARARWNKRKRT